MDMGKNALAPEPPRPTRRTVVGRGLALFGLLAGTGVANFLAACGVTSATGSETTFERVKRTKTVTVGFANQPPFAYVGPDGKVTGQDPETLRAILKPLGVTNVDALVTEFDALIPGLVAKRFDIIAGTLCIRPARCKQIAFSNPNIILQETLVVKKGNPLNLHSYADINKNSSVRIAVLAASDEIDFLKAAGVPDSRIIQFPDDATAFRALQIGRAECWATVGFLAEGQFAKNPGSNFEKVSQFTQPVDANGKSVNCRAGDGFRKEDSDFLNAYNTSLAQLIQSGALVGIVTPFGFTHDDIPPATLTSAELCAGS